MAGSGVVGRVKQAIRPRVARTAQNLVDPAYARRDELAAAVGEIERLLADQLAGEEEATATFGRVLAQLSAQVDALHTEVTRLSALIDVPPDGAAAAVAGGQPDETEPARRGRRTR